MHGEYRIRASQDSSNEQVFEGKTQSDAMEAFVEFLINDQDLIGCISLPYLPGHVQRAFVNNQPTYPDSDREMERYRQVGDYYVDTLASSEGKRRQILQLASEYDVNVQFEGDW